MSDSIRMSADVQGEREAAAMEWFADNLGQPEPQTRLQLERERIAAAIARGLPLNVPKHRYPRLASIRAHVGATDAINAGQPWSFTFRIKTSAPERQLRQERKALRIVRQLALASIAPDAPPVPIPHAAELVGWSVRKIQNAVQTGRLKAATVKRGRGYPSLIAIIELRAFAGV